MRFKHLVPQAPQFSVEEVVSTHAPEQFVVGAAQVETHDVPLQSGVLPVQVEPQLPHEDGVPRDASQPFERLPSQLAKPARHES